VAAFQLISLRFVLNGRFRQNHKVIAPAARGQPENEFWFGTKRCAGHGPLRECIAASTGRRNLAESRAMNRSAATP